MMKGIPSAGDTWQSRLNDKIELWKKELLDTGKRNRMINYRNTKRSTLNILEPGAEELFQRLYDQEKGLTFQKAISRESDFQTFAMLSLMECLSFNLEVQSGDIRTDTTALERDKTLKNLRSKAKLFLDEQGINNLYLSFGFIYWREKAGVGQPLKSPLLLMPVTLRQRSIRSPFELRRADDDDVSVNLTLRHLFERDYNIRLPEFTVKGKKGADAFVEFMLEMEEIADRTGWRVTWEVSLSLLSFLKVSMWNDLEQNRNRILAHPILQTLSGNRDALPPLPADVDRFNPDTVAPGNCHEVVDADSSQQDAIYLSRKGVSFVMQGPPGTGKSQTITNIIAEALADGRTVLFVSEKAAALEVVLKRLKEVGLDSFCLPLHSSKANKKEVIRSIRANLGLRVGAVNHAELRSLSELSTDRRFMNEYADQLHELIPPMNESLYSMLGRIARVQGATRVDFALSGIENVTADDFLSMQSQVETLERALQALNGRLSEHPWFETRIRSARESEITQMQRETENLSQNLRQIAAQALELDHEIGTDSLGTFADVEKLLAYARILKNRPEILLEGWFREDVQKTARCLLADVKNHAGIWHSQRAKILNVWQPEALMQDPEQLKALFPDVSGYMEIQSLARDIRTGKAKADALWISLQRLSENGLDAFALFQMAAPDTLSSLERMARLLQLLAERPALEMEWMDSRRNGELLPLVEQAARNCEEDARSRKEIAELWEDSVYELEPEELLARYRADYDDSFRMRQAAYEQDLTCLRQYARTPDAVCPQKIRELLPRVIQIHSEQNWFTVRQQELSSCLGPLWRGNHTDWNRAEAWIREAITIAEERDLAEEALQRGRNYTEAKNAVTRDWESSVFRLDGEMLLTRFRTDYGADFTRDRLDYEADLESLNLHLRSGSGDSGRDPLPFLMKARDHNDFPRWFVPYSAQMETLFPGIWCGERTDWDVLQQKADRALKIGTRMLITEEAWQRGTDWVALREDIQKDWDPSVLYVSSGDLLERFQTLYRDRFLQALHSYEEDRRILARNARAGDSWITIPNATEFLEKRMQLRKLEAQIGEKADTIALFTGETVSTPSTWDWRAAEVRVTDVSRAAGQADILAGAISRGEQYQRMKEELLRDWSASILELDADGMLNRFQTQYSSFFGKLSGGYRQDLRTLQGFAKTSGTSLDRDSAVALLQKVKTVRDLQSWFTDNASPIRDGLGGRYLGEDSHWAEVRELLDLRGKLSDMEQALNAAREAEAICGSLLQNWDPAALTLEPEAMLLRVRSEYTEAFFAGKQQYEQDLHTLQMYARDRTRAVTDSAAMDLLQKLRRMEQIRNWMSENDTQLRDILGSAFGGLATDWSALRADLDNAGQIRGQMPLVEEILRRGRSFRRLHAEILEEWDESVFSMDLDSMLGRFRTRYTPAFQARLAQYRTDRGMLDRYAIHPETTAGDRAARTLLENLHRVREEKRWIETCGSSLQHCLGRDFTGPDSDWQALSSRWDRVLQVTHQQTLLEEALKRHGQIVALQQELGPDWDPAVSDLEAEAMQKRFRSDYTDRFLATREACAQDRMILEPFAKKQGLVSDDAAVLHLLQQLRDRKERNDWFAGHREALGRVSADGNADWVQLRNGLRTAQALIELFPGGIIPAEVRQRICSVVQERMPEVQKLRLKLTEEAVAAAEEELQRILGRTEKESGITRTILPEVDDTTARMETQLRCLGILHPMHRTGNMTGADLMELTDSLGRVQEQNQWFLTNRERLGTLFGENMVGPDCDWEQVEPGLNCARDLMKEAGGNLKDGMITCICTPKGDAARQSFVQAADALDNLVQETRLKLKAFEDQFENADFSRKPMGELADQYDICVRSYGELSQWLDYREARENCDRLGLQDFTARIAEADNTIPDVSDAFQLQFATLWLSQMLKTKPLVERFRRSKQEERIRNFRQLDEKQMEIARKVIRHQMVELFPSKNSIRFSNGISLLSREAEKKTWVLPIRRLFQRPEIPELVQLLKPCFMMSPLSVAYFLDADQFRFDLVIFDEASQVFPQDAVGAIARGKQVIIAGDTKQLPPTSFFTSSTNNSDDFDPDDEDSEEWENEEVYESILEQAANCLPSRTLLWHYRSRHEHLIAFSNQSIYHNELITFPGPSGSEPDTGVEFEYVEDGFYESSPRSCNRAEARRCAALVEEHFRKYPDRSLGIIAFSEKQQAAILREIQKLRENRPELEKFFAEDKEDEFFVKNLENVQGDERDTIFFSIGYARTKEQKLKNAPLPMRFGPLGLPGGERRLNVAITRARINVKLVSSILPTDIDLNRTKSEGVRMLRDYLAFARNSSVSLEQTQRKAEPDGFADAVAKYIRDHGYAVKQHVGCSDYRVDIAVQRPGAAEEEYAAGIECDGPSYHMARTARDRDRLRASVLEGMGWKLYRVWAVEWYQNPTAEGKNLMDFIERCVKEQEAKQAARQAEEASRRAESVRKAVTKEREETPPLFRGIQKKESPVQVPEKKENQSPARPAPSRTETGTSPAAEKKAGSKTQPIYSGSFTTRDRKDKRKGSTAWTKPEPAKREPEKHKVPEIEAGLRVRHRVFGIGNVIKVEPKGLFVVKFTETNKEMKFNREVFEKGFLWEY